MGEKTLAPTYIKLKQARESGQIAVSQDIAKAAKLLILNEVVFAGEPLLRALFERTWAQALDTSSRPIDSNLVWQVALMMTAAGIVATLIAAFIATLATMAQTQMNMATKALSQGADKLNPGNNLKQLFSLKKLITTGISLVKVVLLVYVGSSEVMELLPSITEATTLSPSHVWTLSAQCLHGVVRSGGLLLLVISAADYGFQKYTTYKSLQVDHEEQKRHYKEMEGDPHAKHARRSLAHEILHEPGQKASAVVVNPEHFAVALAYEFDPRTMPKVVAKARDLEALMLISQAVDARIPVFRHVRLARLLYKSTATNQVIPREAIADVAKVYVAVSQLRKGVEMASERRGIYTIDLTPPPPEDRSALPGIAKDAVARQLRR